MVSKQTVCLRQLGETRAGEVKLGRWLSNTKVNKEELSESIANKVSKLCCDRHVLCIQDTTELHYDKNGIRVKGLGPVANGDCKGFYLHPMLVVDADEQTCLGLAHLKSWVRTRIKKKEFGDIYRQEKIEDKESYRWLESSIKAKEKLSSASQLTIIADRESDIYEEWYRIPDNKVHLLTRACRNRLLSNGEKLFDYADNLCAQGCYQFPVKGRLEKKRARIARMVIRFSEVEIKRPARCTDSIAPPLVKLTVVDVREQSDSVPKGEPPIHWRLLTTHSVNRFEGALQVVQWYCQRWHIEQLFRTMQKQGLDIESSQVESAEGLMKLATLACFAAVRIMQLTLARSGGDQALSVVFTNKEQKLLKQLQGKLEGKTKKLKNPQPQDRLSWASWIVARLGGWKGYASESPPGPITLSRGYKRFKDMYEGWDLIDVCID